MMHNEHHCPSAFLQRLLGDTPSAEADRLVQQMRKTECDDRCLRRAVGLVGVTALLALCGLGYVAVLQPDLFFDDRLLLLRGLKIVGLASLICLLGFAAHWFGARRAARTLHIECRQFVLRESRQRSTRPNPPTVESFDAAVNSTLTPAGSLR